MVQPFEQEQAQKLYEGVDFHVVLESERSLASNISSSTTRGSWIASAQAEDTIPANNQGYEQIPHYVPHRVGQPPRSAQNSRQQTETPTEDACGFVRSQREQLETLLLHTPKLDRLPRAAMELLSDRFLLRAAVRFRMALGKDFTQTINQDSLEDFDLPENDSK